MITIQKTTRISITRYLQIMQQQLEGRLAAKIQFMDIPTETKVYEGKFKKKMENATNLLIFDLQLECKKVITEEGNQFGLLSLAGQTNWEGQDLKIKFCLMEKLTLPTPEDMLSLPLQIIQIKIPMTQ